MDSEGKAHWGNFNTVLLGMHMAKSRYEKGTFALSVGQRGNNTQSHRDGMA